MQLIYPNSTCTLAAAACRRLEDGLLGNATPVATLEFLRALNLLEGPQDLIIKYD